MNKTATIREPNIALPPEAPLVRITAGAGSAGQKTWNLRRPVTLIGSRRPAHIVLHGKEISAAHCVIVNTGMEVLLKDLHTSGGTVLNKEPADLAVLTDGDVIVVGGLSIQVAIRTPDNALDDSGAGNEYSDPTKLAVPVDLSLVHTETHWQVEDAVSMIGRHENATIRLDHEDVARRHAVLFRFGKDAAIFDLGGPSGIYVNGEGCSLTSLAHGDCITVARFGLLVSLANEEDEALPGGTNGTSRLKSAFSQVLRKGTSGPSLLPSPLEVETAFDHEPADDESADVELTDAERIDHIEDELTSTWDRVNSWQSRLEQDAGELLRQEVDVTSRAEALDARDAELRGQLHDVTQYNEELKLRERELATQAAELQNKRDELAGREKEIEEKEQDLEARLAEAQRRENALNQRWSRLRAVKCSHCGEAVNVGPMTDVTQPSG